AVSRCARYCCSCGPGGTQIHLTAFPTLKAYIVQETEAATEGKSIEWVVGRPEGDRIDAGVPGHFNGSLDSPAAVVPVEQEIFPLDQRLGEPTGVSVADQRLHVAVSLFKTAVVLVFLEHLVADAGDGEKQV